MKKKNRIVIITSNGIRHKYFANYLSSRLNVIGIISENKVSIEKSNPIIKKHFERRDRKELEYFTEGTFINSKVLFCRQGQSNSKIVFDWLLRLKPDFIVLYGSSIIKNHILTRFKVINIHLGLSPYYRGSATNFWCLVDRKPECHGATIHLATPKVDAGGILAQVRPKPEITDRCHDLGCKTIIEGTKLMVKVLRNFDEITSQLQAKKGKLCKRKDFNAKAVIKMWDNFDTDMTAEYIKHKTSRDKKYPICTLK